MSIKNLVVTGSVQGYYSEDMYLGGIAGYCAANNGPCSIENSVNMATVESNGGSSDCNIYIWRARWVLPVAVFKPYSRH